METFIKEILRQIDEILSIGDWDKRETELKKLRGYLEGAFHMYKKGQENPPPKETGPQC